MDTTPAGHRHDTDRLTVAAAAERLGVTHDAIRARLRRGTLEGEKDGEHWFVFLLRDAKQDTDTPPTERDTTATDALVSQLQSEISYLRGELTAAREQAAEERQRADIIQIRYMDALPPKTQEAPGSPRTNDTPVSGSGHGHDTDTTATGWASRFLRWVRGS